MSDLVTVELRNPAGVDIPDVLDLLERGFAANPVVKEREGALDWVRTASLVDEGAVFLARDGDEWVGYVVLEWNQNPGAFSEEAWVSYVYSDGSPGVRRALLLATKEWMQERGIKSIHSINQSGRKDEEMISIAPEFEHEVVGSVIRSTPKE